MRSHLSTLAVFVGSGLIVQAANAFAVAQHSHVTQDLRWWGSVAGLFISGVAASIVGVRIQSAAQKSERDAKLTVVASNFANQPVVEIYRDVDAITRLNGSLADHPAKDGVLKPLFDAIYDSRLRAKPAVDPSKGPANA